MTLEKRSGNHWRFRAKHKGELHTKTFEGGSREAQKAHDLFVVQVRQGIVTGSGMTLESYVDLYRESKIQILAPKTLEDYNLQIDKRIVPHLGRFKLDDIGVLQLKRYYAKLREEGLGDRTIKKNHQILSSIFTEAMHMGYIASNPCKRIKAPKYKRKRNVSVKRSTHSN